MAFTPTGAMRAEAERGLAWRREFGRGGTEVGIARARDISNGSNLPLDTVKRMNSFFARHAVDKQGQGWSPGEDGYPSNGRIAWALWGGDPGASWAKAIVERESNNEMNDGDGHSYGMTVGDYLSAGNGRTISNVEIFKAGSFRDSAGELSTWEVDHLHQMVDNFYKLRQLDRLPNVPVRLDHTRSIKDVVGYITDLRVNGDKLAADIEFTDQRAMEMYSSGTLRSRSIEIRGYEDNSQAFHWPVVAGLAFVDLPAVEGLHSLADQSANSYLFDDKEGSVPATNPEASVFAFNLATIGQTIDYAQVQSYVTGLESELVSLTAANSSLTTENDALKLALQEHAASSRASFVRGLADANKIAAPQVDSLTALAQSLNDEQFAAFAASYEAAPVLTLLADHGNGISNPTGEVGTDETARKIADFGAVIENLRKAGMSDDEIARTNTFKQLTALKTGA